MSGIVRVYVPPVALLTVTVWTSSAGVPVGATATPSAMAKTPARIWAVTSKGVEYSVRRLVMVRETRYSPAQSRVSSRVTRRVGVFFCDTGNALSKELSGSPVRSAICCFHVEL